MERAQESGTGILVYSLISALADALLLATAYIPATPRSENVFLRLRRS